MIGIIIGMCTLAISLVILSYKYYKLNINYTQVKQDYLNTSTEIIDARNTVDKTAQTIKILEQKLNDYEKYTRVMKVEKFVVEPVTIETKFSFYKRDYELFKDTMCRYLSAELCSYLKKHDELYRYEIYKDPMSLVDVVKIQMRLYPFVKENTI